MSSVQGEQAEVWLRLRDRLNRGLRQIAFWVVPSAMAFAALGHVIAGGLYQTGRFVRGDTYYVWGILAGSAVGLLASTLGRLYSSTYYALRDTRTPLFFALVRVGLTLTLGVIAALWLPAVLGLERRWGAAGLTASAGVAGWVEFYLLRRTLNRRIGRTGVEPSFVAVLWLAAAIAAGCGWAVWYVTPATRPVLQALLVLGTYGIAYLLSTYALRVPQARTLLGRLRRTAA
jgi:putative peptidoglycan lipid II flippase